MEAITQRRWLLRSAESASQFYEELQRHLECSYLTARLLANRGIQEKDKGHEFLSPRLASLPDPLLFTGMREAVERLALALARGERIQIHGDYDVDGMTGAALLVESLQDMGAQVDFHIPLRLRDGYGLSAKALAEARDEGVSLVLSVDCGITAWEEARLAASLGIDLIITDHHQPSDRLPEACALINPHLPGDRFPYKDLAGVGVAFFLALALRRKLREIGWFENRREPDLRRQLDLVALGTIADIVPLTGVNRVLVTYGLGLLGRNQRCGLRALNETAGLKEITCGTIGFQVAPRLNAAGRLEDASLGVELLLGSNEEEARTAALGLEACNKERQRIEKETFEQALEHIEASIDRDRRTIVLADDRWHPGVIGIVASRLVERFHRPTVLIALEQGVGKGSARSIRGFHLCRALAQCAHHLSGFGGHEYAAGLNIEREKLALFTESFEALAGGELSEELLCPCFLYDGEVMLDELAFETVGELKKLAPFGPGNPEPVLLVRDSRVQQIRKVGKDHLQFTVRQGEFSANCIAFGMASRRDELTGPLDFLCSPQINQWKGRDSVQLRIRDFRSAEVW